MTIRFFALLSACLSLLAGTACTSFEYTGVTEPALPDSTRVLFFVDKAQIKGDYRTLGTLSFTAPTRWNAADIRRALREQAVSRGADAVLILTMKKVPAGEARADQIQNRSAPQWNVEDNSNSAYTYVKDTINYSSGRDPDKTIYRTEVGAELLRLAVPPPPPEHPVAASLSR